MSRRALRKIDPSLDLSQHLKTVDQLPVPLDTAALFKRAAPLEIEVGCGKGLFLVEASGENPDRNYLGCEVSRKYARFTAAKLARLQRGNAIMVHGDAQRLFRDILPDACAASVHVYFPDPWWKKRHKRRRVLNEPFLKDLERVLELGGVFHFWTDVEEYFQATLELISEATNLSGPHDVSERPAAHDMDYRTHFERRMRLHDFTVHRAEFRRSQKGP
jgi:tRNA (guanine-N7-)-methyltransferase